MVFAPPKILMFGWEFPPHNSGGLGVACQGLTGGLASLGAKITFVLPRKINCRPAPCRFIFGDAWTGKKRYLSGVDMIAVNSPLSPYLTAKSYSQEIDRWGEKDFTPQHSIWREDLVGEAMRYGEIAKNIAQAEDFDVIHCHDWLSLPAGMAAKRASGKPLVFHIHATEYDRVGENGLNREICLIEKRGFEIADAVAAVSDYTKRRVVDCYGAAPKKITVVPNAVNHAEYAPAVSDEFLKLKKNGKKIVLFVGRLTFQKGPDYFLKAARAAARIDKSAMFVFSGSGDMERWLIEEAARLGLADRVVFAGFLRGADLARLYKAADLYVMPSVSEPFGLTSLEALASGAPILISRQSGVGEMVSNCLKCDFWDTDQMAAKILAALRYPALGEELRQNGLVEVKKFDWVDSAKKCLGIYQSVMTA
jgi:glycosyltransferase involved in cell wall biosynthesis